MNRKAPQRIDSPTRGWSPAARLLSGPGCSSCYSAQ